MNKDQMEEKEISKLESHKKEEIEKMNKLSKRKEFRKMPNWKTEGNVSKVRKAYSDLK